MAVTETFDTWETVFGEIAIAETAPLHDDRAEPTLAASPFFIEFDEPTQLDPERVGLVWELPAAKTRAIRLRSPLVSLLIHLLPWLTMLAWPSTPAEIPMPILVQLVFEEPPPPPPAPAPPKPETQFKTGRLASVDQGDTKPKDLGLTTSLHPPSAGEPQPDPTETQTATAAPAPPPLPIPKPAPPKEKSAFQLPKPAGAQVPQHAEAPHEASHAARYAGPAASRDEYLAYLVSLTRQHINLLPMSVVGDRHGETVVSLVVQENGVISHVEVARSSGYPDIDQRIANMVAAVHKAPPLPQWYQSSAAQLIFTMHFPEALEREP